MRRLALLVAVSLCPALTRAAEGESMISVTASFLSLTVQQGTPTRSDERNGFGALVAVDYQRGFGDSFWLRGAVGGGLVSIDGARAQVGVATVGLTYAIDILKYVPYVGLGVGGTLVGGGVLRTKVDPVLDLAAGIEVQASRGFAYGIEGRLEAFAGDTTVFVVGPRLVWKWGYF